jgi:ankyrin repeat protein
MYKNLFSFSRKGHSRLALYLSRSLTTPLHGPEAIECIRHLSLSDLFSNNIIKICHTIKILINDPSRLLASLRNAFYPELNISELFLMTSANPDSLVDSIHMPLLCIASRNGYISFVELLLKYHANINLTTKNNENKTALILAAEYGHEHVVKLLINHNADVSLFVFFSFEKKI